MQHNNQNHKYLISIINKLKKLFDSIAKNITEIDKELETYTDIGHDQYQVTKVNIYRKQRDVLINVKSVLKSCINLLEHSDNKFFIIKYLKAKIRNLVLMFFNKDLFLMVDEFNKVPVIKYNSYNSLEFGNTVIQLKDELLEECIALFSSYQANSKKNHKQNLGEKIMLLVNALNKLTQEIENDTKLTIETLHTYSRILSSTSSFKDLTEERVMLFLQDVPSYAELEEEAADGESKDKENTQLLATSSNKNKRSYT